MRRILVYILCGVVWLNCGMLYSQEDTNIEDPALMGQENTNAEDLLLVEEVIYEEDDTGYLEYNYGLVVSLDIAARKITISEYDWDNDSEINVIYSIEPNVELETVKSLEEIKKGSEIEIEYFIDENGEKIILYMDIYNPEETAVE